MIDNSIIDDSRFGIEPQFGHDSGISLEPYDNSIDNNIIYQWENPLGRYMVDMTHEYNRPLLEVENIVPQINLPENFTVFDVQNACNTICDTLNWRHLPIFVNQNVSNAAFSTWPSIFKRTSFDDSLYINPNYAHDCIEHIGSTDIVLSDIAHEVGHSVAFKQCGDIGTFMNEKLADFVSGFVNGKLGIDIDTARQWFEWHYDGVGKDGYPVSEERWDAEAAGYYFSHIATSEELMTALKDSSFLEIIKNYHHDFHLHHLAEKSPMEISEHSAGSTIDDTLSSSISNDSVSMSPLDISTKTNGDTISNYHTTDISFGKTPYTESEIRQMEKKVSDLESKCSDLKREVHHWENMVSLNPKDSYSYGKLSEAKSHYNDALTELKNAESKLNNAR